MLEMETLEPAGADDLHDEIARLEDRVEELAEALARCRKFDLAAKIAIAGGGVVLVAMTFGFMWFDAMTFIGAMAAVIGGIVVFGSNSATSQQFAAAMRDAEALRADLIGRLDLHVVGDR
jgi:hypothetical protein